MANRGPRFPEGKQYEDLVNISAVFPLSTALAMLNSVQIETFQAWKAKARRGIEPYYSWVVRYYADVTDIRSVKHGPRSLGAIRALRGDYDG